MNSIKIGCIGTSLVLLLHLLALGFSLYKCTCIYTLYMYVRVCMYVYECHCESKRQSMPIFFLCDLEVWFSPFYPS